MRAPDFIIGSKDNPYLLRWFLIPRNPWINLYLHKFLRDDEDRALHDHPWWFLSFVLRGGYSEITRDERRDGYVRCPGCRNDQPGRLSSCAHCARPLLLWGVRDRFSLALRSATHRHRVVLHKGVNGQPLPCWTLVLTGPRIREWGFWCPRGFVHWKDFTRPGNKGEVGRGCE